MRAPNDPSASFPVAIGRVLSGALKRLGLGRPLDDYRVLHAWDQIVGPAIARNAQPSRLDGRRLVVVVRSSAWLQELSLLRTDLCERLNRWMGRTVISDIFLVVGQLDDAPDPASSARRPSSSPKREPLGLAARGMRGDIAEALERLWQAARDHAKE